MLQITTLIIAKRGALLLLSAFVLFHISVITGILPYTIVWGGNAKSASEMQLLESIALGLNLLMLLAVAIYTETIQIKLNRQAMKVVMWLMCLFFILNTVGNLYSGNTTEKVIFTPITVLMAIFCLRLALQKQASKL